MREDRIHKRKLRKTTKRVSILVVALICFISTAVIAFADNDATFTAATDKVHVKRGDSVTITVSTSNMTGKQATSFVGKLGYNKDAFTATEVTQVPKNIVSAPDEETTIKRIDTENGKEKGSIYYIYSVKSDAKDVYLDYNDKLYKATFTVKDTASGKYTFSPNMKIARGTGEVLAKNVGVDVYVDVPVVADSVKLETSNYALNKGDTASIKVNYSPEDTTDSKEFTYTSSDKSVATVDNTGKITAIGKGKAEITVTAFEQTLKANVTVTSHAKSIKLDNSDITITKNNTKQLKATLDPADAEDTITWKSSNENVATVSDTGLVTAKGGGDTTITATANGHTATCHVNVGVPITGISITDGDNFTLTKGGTETKQLTANIEPSDATGNKTIIWTSSDTDVATVDNKGVVTLTGKSKNKENVNNTTTITASVGSGTEEKKTSVTVKVVVPITSFTIDSTKTDNASIDLYPGNDYTVKTTISPDKISTTEDSKITWSTVGDVVTVDEDGKITANSVGDATVTGALADGKKVTINVHVKQPITSIELSGSDDMIIDKSADIKTKLTVSKYYPEKYEQSTDVTWSSSNENIAGISSDGTINPLTTGDVTFTATLNANKNITASRKVKIVATLKDIKINNIKECNVEIGKGKTFTPNVTITPSDTTDDKSITWSSNSDVATVDSKTGVVTGVKGGNATITGKNNKKTITYTVSVVVPIDKVTIDKTGITNNTVTLNKTKNETYKVSAKIGPQDNTEADNTIKFDSSNKKVAIVSDQGVVTPVAGGTTTIIAYAGKNKVKDSITINVIVPMEGISLNKSETTINRKSTEKLIATINPLDTTDSKDITWTSSDSKVATVDKNGVVTGVSKGTAVITASALNGKFTATSIVTVKLVYIDKITGDDISLVTGKNDDVTKHISISPENATETEDINYETDDPSVAYVTPDGKLITGVSEGVANVTVTTSNDKTTTLKVTVKNSLNAKLVTSQKDSLSYLTDDGAVYNMTDITSKDIDEVRLYASSIDDTVTDSDEYLVKSKLGENDKVVGYLDLGLYLLNKKSIVGAATELSNDVKVTIDVPEELIKSGRKFSIIRVHDGGADKLIDLDSDDSTITFETNKFSTYAIVYEAEKENATTVKSNSNTKNPFTSNDVLKYVIALLSSLLVGGASVYALKKAK